MQTNSGNQGLLRKWKLSRRLNIQLFGHKMFIFHNFTSASNQKTSLTNVVKEYALMLIM